MTRLTISGDVLEETIWMVWLEYVCFPHAYRSDFLVDDDCQRMEYALLVNPRAWSTPTSSGKSASISW
jgi:hypothetical protein